MVHCAHVSAGHGQENATRAGSLPVLLAVLTAAACGGSSDSYSFVVVTVKAPPAMPVVVQLRADIINAGKSDTELFPKGQATKPLAFDAIFALALPKSRVGDLGIAVSAIDSSGRTVATGSGSSQIVVGGRADVTIYLALTGDADAGPADSGSGEAGPQGPLDAGSRDAGPLVDAPPGDGHPGQETIGYDGAGGTDMPLTGGAGGTGGMGGQGGQGGSGGGGDIDAEVVGTGGGAGREAGVDLGNLGGSGGIFAAGGAGGTGGISSAGGAGGLDASLDVASSDGTGGVPSTGGVDGGGGISSTGGAGGTGGTTASTDAGAPDAPPSLCSATVPCPSFPNCMGQPTCDPATGLCSAPTQCSVCGNGVLEFSEQCDDGNTISGDHCSSTCKNEYCGDGIVQNKALASLSLVYLARSCGIAVEQDIWLVLNHTEVVRGAVKQTCDCQPGIATLTVTNPAFLALGFDGDNVIEVHTAAEISWAIAHYESPSGPGDAFLVDYGSNGAAQFKRPNLCTNGSYQGREIATGMTLAGGEQCDHGNSNGVGSDTCSITCMVR